MRGNAWGDHHGSHQGLLRSAGDPPPGWTGPDAILVPTARPPNHLAEAARLAQILDCPLVTLHSGKRTAAAWATQLLPDDIDLIAVDIAPPPRLNLPRWETPRLLDHNVFPRRTDQGAKRNLALMLSRMLGWSRILFLDDDITGVDPDEVRRACGLLAANNAVGLHIADFPDHSVVCHAYRQAGGEQQSFIGSGALAVQTERCNSFFPGIYNEDWLFLLDQAGWLQPVTMTGEVRQDPFDPFHDVNRARSEEFGDVLAEGTYWLLDQEQPVFAADTEHWTAFLLKRRQFIERVLEMTRRHDLDRGDKHRMVAALKAALGQLERITPELCERFLRVWGSDREVWQRHLSRLPTGLSRQQALGRLSAPGERPLTRRLRAEHDGRRERLPLNSAVRSPRGCSVAPAAGLTLYP